MGEDDDATVRTLTSYREMMAALINEHEGRVVDSPGDNLLVEFSSVLSAVSCAVEIQQELTERNADLPEARRLEYRIEPAAHTTAVLRPGRTDPDVGSMADSAADEGRCVSFLPSRHP